jgi:chorismate mutase
MKVAEQIGALKKAKCCGLQNKRWNEILGKMILDGEEKGLSRRIYS